VMLAVVVLERLGRDMWLECIHGVGKFGEFVLCHGLLPCLVGVRASCQGSEKSTGFAAACASMLLPVTMIRLLSPRVASTDAGLRILYDEHPFKSPGVRH
jgi:hypothetical protein